ncbi:MAG TPA: lysyl oxidase family protein [Solirubrobacteraceae bacterium]|nr:lysyl oxidase family protein [Solirubrobacteraceae bacterium]
MRHILRPSLLLILALPIALSLRALIRQADAGPSVLLPNLVATPPDTASLEVSANEGGIDMAEGEAKLLLRFDGYVHNDGYGALDMRGSRSAPIVGVQAKEEIERRETELKEEKTEQEEGKEPKEPSEFSAQTELELASPAMQAHQRLFSTNIGTPTSNPEASKEEAEKFNKENEEYLERGHKEEPSGAEMFYVNADGHHHWHLQHIAKYSLWNASKTAEVAPSEKVGFCLEDSEQVEETNSKPGFESPVFPVYSDYVAPYRDFCQRYLPDATHVYEGISPGWRDKYDYTLGFQWVDVSNVLPGEYWLREEVDPEHDIREEGLGEKVAYASESTIVPGFDALPQQAVTQVGEPVTITTTARAWDDSNPPDFAIVSGPQHGQLEPISGTDRVIYRPEPGYTGPDSFSFAASDPYSPFPRSPASATVSIGVGPAPSPAVAISGAPATMIAGTSVQLSAHVANDSPTVTWSAGAGSIAPGGLYTAPSEPPRGGTATIAAVTSKGARAQVSISIRPAPIAAPAPAALSHCRLSARAPVCRPEAILLGRKLVMTTKVGRSGHVKLSAYAGRRPLGACLAKISAHRTFTCRLTLPKHLGFGAKIAVVASLRAGRLTFSSRRPPAPVPQMKMAFSAPGKRSLMMRMRL